MVMNYQRAQKRFEIFCKKNLNKIICALWWFKKVSALFATKIIKERLLFDTPVIYCQLPKPRQRIRKHYLSIIPKP